MTEKKNFTSKYVLIKSLMKLSSSVIVFWSNDQNDIIFYCAHNKKPIKIITKFVA